MIATFSIDLDVDDPTAIARALRHVADQVEPDTEPLGRTVVYNFLDPDGNTIFSSTVKVGESFVVPLDLDAIGRYTLALRVQS